MILLLATCIGIVILLLVLGRRLNRKKQHLYALIKKVLESVKIIIAHNNYNYYRHKFILHAFHSYFLHAYAHDAPFLSLSFLLEVTYAETSGSWISL